MLHPKAVSTAESDRDSRKAGDDSDSGKSVDGPPQSRKWKRKVESAPKQQRSGKGKQVAGKSTGNPQKRHHVAVLTPPRSVPTPQKRQKGNQELDDCRWVFGPQVTADIMTKWHRATRQNELD